MCVQTEAEQDLFHLRSYGANRERQRNLSACAVSPMTRVVPIARPQDRSPVFGPETAVPASVPFLRRRGTVPFLYIRQARRLPVSLHR